MYIGICNLIFINCKVFLTIEGYNLTKDIEQQP
jgi:hypothetical protein